MVMVTVFC